MMFAIITPALITGAVVERMKFSTLLVFAAVWSVIVYYPLAHMVWGGGWLQKLGVLDFAGGTVVHISSGIAALVVAIVVGRRKNTGRWPIVRITFRSSCLARACSGSDGSASTPAAPVPPTRSPSGLL